jgi:hypothetical protein
MDENGNRMSRSGDESEPLVRVGDCLHSSFTADNHDSLGDDIVRPMLHLSNEAKTASMRPTLGSGRLGGVRGGDGRQPAEARNIEAEEDPGRSGAQ